MTLTLIRSTAGPGLSALVAVLKHHVEIETTTIKGLALAFGHADNTVGAWLNGRGGPMADRLIAAFPRLPRAVQDDVLALFGRAADGSNEDADVMARAIDVDQTAASLVKTVHELQQDPHATDAPVIAAANLLKREADAVVGAERNWARARLLARRGR